MSDVSEDIQAITEAAKASDGLILDRTTSKALLDALAQLRDVCTDAEQWRHDYLWSKWGLSERIAEADKLISYVRNRYARV